MKPLFISLSLFFFFFGGEVEFVAPNVSSRAADIDRCKDREREFSILERQREKAEGGVEC